MSLHTAGTHTGVTDITTVAVHHPPVQVLIKVHRALTTQPAGHDWMEQLPPLAPSVLDVKEDYGLSVSTQRSPLGPPFISSPGQPHTPEFHLLTTPTKHRRHCREACGLLEKRKIYVYLRSCWDMKYNFRTQNAYVHNV